MDETVADGADAPVASIVHLAADASVAEVVEILARSGAVIIDGLFGPDDLQRVYGELRPHLDAAVPAGGDFFGHATKGIPGALAKAPAFATFVVHPLLLGVADEVLLPAATTYQLQISTAQEVWAGGADQPLHRDEQVYGPVLDYGPDAPQYVLGVIVAGTDFTRANGATRVAPGSHAWPEDRRPAPDDAVPAEMTAGSAMIYFGRTVHGAAVNTTSGPRMAFIFGYSVGWLRQEENLLVECPPDIVAALPERVQQLVGYQAYSPILGWAAERDLELLTRPAPPGQVWPASVATVIAS